jgi:hypothetical protein
MILISHRGNISGPNPERENSPDYILEALNSEFDVEIDLWSYDTKLFLGHDNAKYEINKDFIENNKDKLWIHCKNLEALYVCQFILNDVHYFWHQNDDYTLTSKNIFWTFPGKDLTPNSILVNFEKINYISTGSKIYGVCSDYLLDFYNK